MFEWRGVLAGVGILIFAMFTMEEALRKLGGHRMKKILDTQTNTNWKAIFTGTRVTGIVQSSSLVTLILLAFVGAGAIALQNAVGVVVGAGIGTTVTSLIVAAVGFGEVSIASFAFPIITIGGALLIFAKSEQRKAVARLLLGFGLIFLGLEMMKESVEAFKQAFELSAYQGISLWKMGLIGLVVTAILQSSSSVGVLTLTALGTGIISLPASVAIIIGASVGTSVTGVLASLGGRRIKRQLSLAQVIYKLCGALIGVIFFWQYIWLVVDFLGLQDNLVMANAVFNVIFNASMAVLFGFFIGPFTRLITWLLPSEGDEVQLRIDDIQQGQGEDFVMPKLLALQADMPQLLRRVLQYDTYLFGFQRDLLLADHFDQEAVITRRQVWNKERHKTMYIETKALIDHMRDFLGPLQNETDNPEALQLAENLEATLYACLKSIKSFKNIYRDVVNLKGSSTPQMQDLYNDYLQHLAQVFRNCGLIIEERYPSESLELIDETTSHIEEFEESMIEKLSAQNLNNHEKFDLDLPTMLNLNHYQYQGSQALLIAIKLRFTGDQPDDNYRPFAR